MAGEGCVVVKLWIKHDISRMHFTRLQLQRVNELTQIKHFQ